MLDYQELYNQLSEFSQKTQIKPQENLHSRSFHADQEKSNLADDLKSMDILVSKINSSMKSLRYITEENHNIAKENMENIDLSNTVVLSKENESNLRNIENFVNSLSNSKFKYEN